MTACTSDLHLYRLGTLLAATGTPVQVLLTEELNAIDSPAASLINVKDQLAQMMQSQRNS